MLRQLQRNTEVNANRRTMIYGFRNAKLGTSEVTNCTFLALKPRDMCALTTGQLRHTS